MPGTRLVTPPARWGTETERSTRFHTRYVGGRPYNQLLPEKYVPDHPLLRPAYSVVASQSYGIGSDGAGFARGSQMQISPPRLAWNFVMSRLAETDKPASWL